MRFRVDVSATTSELAWEDVFSPARAVAYDLIAGSDPALATQLHDHGWDGHSLRPIGVSSPMFRGAPRLKGRYTTSPYGSIWFGSPVPQIAAALLAGLAGRTSIRWGRAELTVKGVELEQPPEQVAKGEITVTTTTPVLVKQDEKYLSPDHPGFADLLTHNLRHKADLLALPVEVETEVLDAGPMRRFRVGKAHRHGATVTARLAGDPALLTALHAWGLGLGNNQGFGWIR
jgi:CRISPR-associated endoribonuclease Cas6